MLQNAENLKQSSLAFFLKSCDHAYWLPALEGTHRTLIWQRTLIGIWARPGGFSKKTFLGPLSSARRAPIACLFGNARLMESTLGAHPTHGTCIARFKKMQVVNFDAFLRIIRQKGAKFFQRGGSYDEFWSKPFEVDERPKFAKFAAKSIKRMLKLARSLSLER